MHVKTFVLGIYLYTDSYSSFKNNNVVLFKSPCFPYFNFAPGIYTFLLSTLLGTRLHLRVCEFIYSANHVAAV